MKEGRKGALTKASISDLIIYFNMHLSKSPGVALIITTSSSSSHDQVVKHWNSARETGHVESSCSMDIKRHATGEINERKKKTNTYQGLLNTLCYPIWMRRTCGCISL